MRNPMRSTTIVIALVLALLAGACSDGRNDEADADSPTESAESTEPDAADPTGENPACERLSADSVSFAVGEEFTADTGSATDRTCRYARTAAAGDSINLSVSESDLDPTLQLDSLAASPATDVFRAVELGDGAFYAEIDARPRAGVFVDGELIELVLVLETSLNSTNRVDEMLLILLAEAAGV